LSRTPLVFVCIALASSLYACSATGGSNVSPPTGNQALTNGSSAPRAAVAAATATAPTHISTWAYDEYWGPGANGTTAEVQEYLSYAEGGLGNSKALTDCSGSTCQSVFYVDPNFLYSSTACASQASVDALAAVSNEDWYIHEAGYTDAAHRVHGDDAMSCNGSTVTVPVDVLNDYNTKVQAYFLSYLRTNANGWDDYFMDDTSGEVLTQMYGPGGGFCANNPPDDYCTTTQELPKDADVVYEHASFANAMTHTDGDAMKFFYNGLTFSDGAPSDLDVLSSSTHYVGVVCEDCVVNSGTFRPTMYGPVLTAMSEVDAISGAQFVEINNGASASGSAAQIAQRLITIAIAWLGYSSGHTSVFENLESNTENLAAWPEESIVPASPVQTMSSGSTAAIEVATGVYRREFASCTNAGVAIGPCAAFVNSTGSAVKVLSSWLHETYGHVITLSGGDVVSGGKALLTSTTFTPNATTIPADQSLLISR